MIAINEYKVDEENMITKLIIKTYKTEKYEDEVYPIAKSEKVYEYIIPIEFTDEVMEYEWEVLYGTYYTPVTVRNSSEDKAVGLNNITPFARSFKSGKFIISSQNERDSYENNKLLVWTNLKDLALGYFNLYIDEALKLKQGE